MSTPRIGLVHPPLSTSPSGGDLYDRWMLREGQARGFPLQGVPCGDGALPSGRWDLLVWDGLLLDRLARIADERMALLLHYLPSLDPALDRRRRAALAAAERRALARADFIIATGGPVAEAAGASAPGTPVFLCEPGVAEVFSRQRASSPGRRARPQGVPQLLTVAHLLPPKGHGLLLDALAQARDLPWHWHVVGDDIRSPATARELRERAAVHGLAQRITWHGALGQEAVAALMAGSDLFVFPSTFEAYGMAMAEAVAAGLPVLAHRVGAAEQLVRHEATGCLVDVGDRDGFAAHLRQLLGDPGLRAAFRRKLRESPVRSWDDAFADFQGACETMLGHGM
ncbi:MAG: glycosyltransferase family 4 protein [Pseudomonadota bacterium]|nr:glycosyltransferase family 4 protein [Pseudomonadota bacterium]